MPTAKMSLTEIKNMAAAVDEPPYEIEAEVILVNNAVCKKH